MKTVICTTNLFYGQAHHCHLRCLQCGKVIEFFEEDLKTIEKRLEKKYHYEIVDHRLDVNGYCPECKKGL